MIEFNFWTDEYSNRLHDRSLKNGEYFIIKY
jgi:hypothetical protein